MWKFAHQFRTDLSAAVTAFIAVAIPVLLLIGGLATDVSLLNAQKRYVQSQADLAAQSAARHLPDVAKVRFVARQVVAANAAFGEVALADEQIEFGSHNRKDGFVRSKNQSNPVGATAVRVKVRSPFNPILLRPVLQDADLNIQRSATAAQEAIVVFTLRNRLLSLNTRESVLDSLLGPLGLGLTLNVLGYEGLANSRVKLDDFLGLLSLGLAAEAVTFKDVLELPLTFPIVFSSLFQNNGFPAGQVTPGVPANSRISLAEILDVSPSLLHARVGDVLPNITVNGFDLIMAFLGLATSPDQRLGVATKINLFPLADLSLTLGLIRPPVIAIGRVGDTPSPTAIASQVSAGIRANVLGDSNSALLHLDADVQIATASAEIISLNCGATLPAEQLASFTVQTAPVHVAISLGLLASNPDLSQPTLTPIDVAGRSQTINIRLEQLQTPVLVNNPLNLSGMLKGISNLLIDLSQQLRVQAKTCEGFLDFLLCPLKNLIASTLSGLLKLISGLLSGLGWLLDTLQIDKILQTLLKLLGIDVAQAELILDDYSCSARLIE